VTSYLPIDEKHNYSKTYLQSMLAQLLGGRAAEKIVFNEFTTGAGNDIERATEIARKMVCEWGMSDVLGPVTFGKKEEEIFLGREISQHRDYSESTAQVIDQDVRKIITEAQEIAEKLLNNNIKLLHDLSKALLDHEILDGAQIEKVMKGQKLSPKNVKSETVEKKPRAKKAASRAKPTEKIDKA
jgi:cell division protease FtsH